MHAYICVTDRQIETERERETDRPTDRQTESERDYNASVYKCH